MKKILVLGAGMVSKPGVTYLLKNKFPVTVADINIKNAERLVKDFNNGTACQLAVENEAELNTLIRKNDIVVSLLPWEYHVRIATLCLKNNKPMVTASYVSDEMRKLNNEAKKKGLILLNEIGVDPGMDHISAMKIIDEVRDEGGKILHFYSYCGGLPAPEANDNPFGYKFSWSPKGVVLASKNSAQFLENGKEIYIEGKDLFLNKRIEEVEGLGKFEVYPNRDSLPYKDLYNLTDALTVMRGTYRNIGWCDTFKIIVDLGLVDETPLTSLKGITYKKMMADLIRASKQDNAYYKVAGKMGLSKDNFIMKNLQWLGLFNDTPVPDCNNRLDILCALLLEKLIYREGERDMLILCHKFTIENEDKSQKMITSTLIDYGIPYGDSSMARTVSFPLAIGVKLIAEGKINLTGVQIPIKKEIYIPVLKELETLGIKMVEKEFVLK